ncbi:AMP-binding protein [Lentzea sp. NPDC059081]|uniref:AMP-binding protein n=1 Tax=Lentzea sp. NPDC059081 TaxID=3346719 RepID=UPI00368BB124
MNLTGFEFTDPGDVDLTSYVFGTSAPADRPALIDCSDGTVRLWTYGRLRSAIRDLAELLSSRGVRPGDVVAVLTENSSEFVVAYYGVLRSGATVLPLDPHGVRIGWTSDLAATGARMLVVDPALWPGLDELPQGALPLGVLPVDELPRGTGSVVPRQKSADEFTRTPGGAATAVLLSSSGTGGHPHKAAITHRNLTAGLAQIAAVHRLRPREVVVAAGPLRHVYGMQMALNPVLRAGGTLLIGPVRFRLARFLDLLRTHRAGIAYLVPSVLAEIASLPGPVDLPDLRLIVSGGAPLPEAVARECERLTSRPVVQGYGMTEAGCISFTPDDRPVPAGTVGVVLPGTEARFVDPDTGADVPAGRPGELVLRGPQITPGYVDAPGVEIGDADGWLHTGDLAVRDDEGNLRIVGRLKSLIKYRGHQVAPARLEEALQSHPAVSDALVVGVPDPMAGEVPKAYVVCSADTPLAEILAHVAARVAPHEKVRQVQRVPRIPRSGTGKAVRPEPLRALVVRGAEDHFPELPDALHRAGIVVRASGPAAAVAAADSGQIDVVFDAGGSDATPPALLAASRVARGGRLVVLRPRAHWRPPAELVERASADGISVISWTSSSMDAGTAVAVALGALDHLSGQCAAADVPGTSTSFAAV